MTIGQGLEKVLNFNPINKKICHRIKYNKINKSGKFEHVSLKRNRVTSLQKHQKFTKLMCGDTFHTLESQQIWFFSVNHVQIRQTW